jgi:transposase
MRFYQQQHRFYCGIDLHARSMYLCILDQGGTIVYHQNLAAEPAPFLKAIAPYRDDLVVCCECLFAWYWLADLCAAEKIPFVLGHALYLKAIHGGKTKNDKLDAEKLARLLRGGNLPMAYVYPKGQRETRDLLRRRTYFVRQRAALLTHVQLLNSQYNHAPFTKKLSYAANREELQPAERFTDPSVRRSVEANLALSTALEEQIGAIELYLTRSAKVDDPQTYARLRSVPGVGAVLALILLYEIHDIQRFPTVGQFLSYARLVRCPKESAGKKTGGGNGSNKIGNAHLKWAFSEAACLFLRGNERAQTWLQRREAKHGKAKALAILAARLGRAVYWMLRRAEVFDVERFWSGRRQSAPSVVRATSALEADWATRGEVPDPRPAAARSTATKKSNNRSARGAARRTKTTTTR